MCGRYTLRANIHDLAQIFEVVRGIEEWKPRYNLAPSQTSLCIRKTDQLEFFRPKWGLIPFWSKDKKNASHCINARSETVHSKPSFREAFKKRRCLVIANGVYEWFKKEDEKQPYYISLTSERPMAFAGLWETWNSPDGPMETCTFCTTDPNDLVGRVHDRMPVILAPESYDLWLDPTVTDPEAIKPLLLPYPSYEMEIWPVSQEANTWKNDYPSLLEPIGEVMELAFA